ncbi:ATP-binding cassette subfamily B protein [Friedmanniella endophytica]|uniref:ATP-binding cassette subfamily B protein n=1 Tax=Microlunatus kandeliicorticis TaxID=1759536 RepID=A0A7W3IQT1_9ACTN|nr:ABC transporter ATP-binding protein [Microlunatus kandeliicorticis]MBA8793510.1 ATP-binding cassette subfamily B protein [Microlunatus kandeliicorticis]
MSADLSAAPRTSSPQPDLPTPDPAPSAGRPSAESVSVLDRQPALAAPSVDRRGNPRTGASASLWRFRTYLNPYKGRFIGSFVFAGIGVGAAIVVPLVTRAVIDGPIAHSDRRGIYSLGLLAMTLGVVEALLMFGRRWIVSKATLGTEYDIRFDLYAKLQRLPMAFHGHWQSGQLLSRIMNDLSTVRRFLGFGMLFILVNIAQIAVVVGILLHLYWPLGLVVLVSIVPIVWLCLRTQREYTRLSRKVQDETGDVASTVEEGALGLRVIKSFGRSWHIFGKFDQRSTKLYDTSIRRVKLQSFFWTFLEVIPNLTLIVVLALGALAAGQGRLSLGTLVGFTTLMVSLVWPIASLGFLLSMAQESMTAADRIAEIFDTENTITDGHAELGDVRGHLRLEGVGFHFPDDGIPVLHDLDLEVLPGETVAVVGSTGAGKTVLTSLVPRLYDVTAGRITVDGVDVRELPLARLRQVVATAFEDPTLFSMSARENLTLGRPDATEEEIAEAIDVAQAHFVHDLPWGLDTRIGEQGMSLSGGQRQRLALARAVLTKPAILVLDDTLSALDIHTEALVEEALKRVLVGVTGIVVAHRASTVLLADKVALLSGGTITAVGTHSELLATVPEYQALMSAEFDDEEGIDRAEERLEEAEFERAELERAGCEDEAHDQDQYERAQGGRQAR